MRKKIIVTIYFKFLNITKGMSYLKNLFENVSFKLKHRLVNFYKERCLKMENNGRKCYVVAEIGCNHLGNIDIAKRMIEITANYCKVDAVKFQKRCIRELLSEEQYNAPHPHPKNAYGETYGKHREALEFSLEQHKELMEYCKKNHVVYSASVWDLTSAKEIASLQPEYIKIPSASNLNFKMLQWLCENYLGEIHLSLGMTTLSEEERIVELFIDLHRNKDLVLYACTSGYPVPYSDACILEIKRLKYKYGGIVKKIGYSGHHIGISLDGAIAALEPDIIERHFTLNNDWKGTDHKASLLPEQMKELVINLELISQSLKYKEKEILPIEEVQRIKLKNI